MRQSNIYTFLFVIIISIAAALILSVASQSLKEKQQFNIERDMKKNILTAVGFSENENCKPGNVLPDNTFCDLLKCYRENIKSFIIDNNGKVKKTNMLPEGIDFKKELEKPENKRNYPIFKRMNGNDINSFCIPLVGKGLWGSIYGYLALEKDLVTVKGVSFYKHSETPGLGAEIDRKWFLDNFKGKKILDEKGDLVSIKIVKGKAFESSKNYIHEVDGISGATLTSDFVSKLIKNNLLIFEAYFKLIRKGAE